MGREKLGWLAGTAALSLALAACTGGAPARRTPAPPVRVAVVEPIDAPTFIQASGIVEPMRTVAVTAQVSGTLLDVRFAEGDFVQKGQVLFRIDPRPLQDAVAQARAVLRRDQAQAEAAARDDTRYRRLADMGYVSREQSDQMHAAALAQAATVAADRAALRTATVNLGFATIRAPMAGRTGSLLIRPGNNVSPSSGALVVINQLSPVLVRFPILEQDFRSLQQAMAGQPLHVSAMAADSTRTTDEGQLSFLDNAVDSLTGTVTGKALFQNPGRRLWPGQLVLLRVQVRTLHNVLAVPTEAVLTGQQGPYVFVVDANSKALMQPVAPGTQLGDTTVIERGLAAGERVVVDGQSRLSPGARVSILPPGTDTGTARLGAYGSGGTQGSAGGEVSAVRPGGAVTSARPPLGAGAGAAPASQPASLAGRGTSASGATTSGAAAARGTTAPGATMPAPSVPPPSAPTTGSRPPTPPTTGTTPIRP